MEVSSRNGEGQDNSGENQCVKGEPRGELVQDVRDTTSLQGGFDIVSIYNVLDFGFNLGVELGNGWQDISVELGGKGLGTWLVLSDKALTSDQLTGVFSSSSS